MASRPVVRVKVSPKFPSQVVAGDGISIDQSGGVVTISLDESSDSSPDEPPFPNYSTGVANQCVATWPSRADTIATGVFVDVCWSAPLGMFMCNGNTSVATSVDGLNYTSRTGAATGTLHGCIWIDEFGGRFVAVSSGSTTTGCHTSADGITWTPRATPNTNSWDGICYINRTSLKRLVAVAYTGASGRVMTSDDGGTTWTAREAAAANAWADVAYSDTLDRLVACANSGTGNRVMYSDDHGETWTSVSISPDRDWDSVVWVADFGGRFVMVNYSGVTDSAAYSANGIDWTFVTTPTSNQWTRLAYSPQLKMLAATSNSHGGSNGVMTSNDGGVTWETHTTTADSWGGICWSPELGIFAATSWGSTKMRSTPPSAVGRFAAQAGGTIALGTANPLANRQITIAPGNLPFAGLGFASNSDTALWALGHEPGGGNRFALYNAGAAAYALLVDASTNVMTMPAYSTGIAKFNSSGVISTAAGVTDLAATTANRLFGTNGSGTSGLVTLPAAGITLSAGALALANDLAALEGLGSTGIAARTTTDTWAQRTITGTASQITVSNGDGVSGNPTLSLPSDVSITTSLTVPLLAGGSGAASTLTLESTSGSGTSDAIIFKTGSQSERGRINTSGQWTIGANLAPNTGVLLTVNKNAAALPAPTFSGAMAQYGNADGTSTRWYMDSFAINSTINFRRANGTAASPTALTAGNRIAAFFFEGCISAGTYNSTDAAGIHAYATTNFTGSNAETDIAVNTIPNGSLTSAEVIRFLGAGNLKFTNAANFSANNTVATVLGSVGPTGANTTVQEWLTFKNAGGTTRYVPCF